MEPDLQPLREWFGSGAWCIDLARVVGSALVLGGWIETADEACVPSVEVNGRPVDWFTAGIRLPNLAVAFPFLPNADAGGFRARIALSESELAAADVRVECVDARTRRSLWPAQSVWVPLRGAADADVALPAARRIARISGSDSADVFRLEGASMARNVEAVCARHGMPITHGTRVLDWGVGCGRLARFLSRIDGVDYVGVDVDADNIGWCRSALGGAYESVPLLPPTRFGQSAFDVVVGLSVVTHLRESVQLRWLEELARITQPRGLVLLSILGEQAASRGLRGEASIDAYRRSGFVFGKERHALDAILEDADYYGTAFHQCAYVRNRWSTWFEVIEIVPAAIGNHQDLVVMRSLPG